MAFVFEEESEQTTPQKKSRFVFEEQEKKKKKSPVEKIGSYLEDTARGAVRGAAMALPRLAQAVTDPASMVQLPFQVGKGVLKLSQRSAKTFGPKFATDTIAQVLDPTLDLLEAGQQFVEGGAARVEEAEEKSPIYGPGTLMKRGARYLADKAQELVDKFIAEPETALGRTAEATTTGGPAALFTGIQQGMKELGFDEDESTAMGLLGSMYAAKRGNKKKYELSDKPSYKEIVDFPDGPDNYLDFFDNELVPELQQNATKLLEQETAQAKQQAQAEYNQELAKVKAEHQAKLAEIAQSDALDEQTYREQLQDFENKKRNIAAEHQQEIAEIDQLNKQQLEQYETELQGYRESLKELEKLAVPEEIKPPVERQTKTEGVIRSPTVKQDPTLFNEVGNIVAKVEVDNPTSAGKALSEVVRKQDQEVYSDVNEAYKKSREANKGIQTIHPNAVDSLIAYAEDKRQIPNPSTPTKNLLKAVDNILEELAVMDESGNVTGYKPINNQTLIDQIQELRTQIDYDFEHGDAYNIYKPVIGALEKAAETAASKLNRGKAARLLRNAKDKYRNWAETYNNDYMRPLRDKSNQDYTKHYRTFQDIDELNMLKRAVGTGTDARNLLQSLKRSLAEKRLEPFIKKPKEIDIRKFERELRALKPVLEQEQINNIRDAFKKARSAKETVPEKVQKPKEPKLKEYPTSVKIPIAPKKPRPKERLAKLRAKLPEVKELTTPEMKYYQRLSNLSGEEIANKTRSVEGIREMRSVLEQTERGKEIFDRFAKKKLKSILLEGKLEGKLSKADVYDVLNNEKNYAIASEILGEELASDLFNAAKEGKGRFTIKDLAQIARYGKKAAMYKFLMKLF